MIEKSNLFSSASYVKPVFVPLEPVYPDHLKVQEGHSKVHKGHSKVHKGHSKVRHNTSVVFVPLKSATDAPRIVPGRPVVSTTRKPEEPDAWFKDLQIRAVVKEALFF